MPAPALGYWESQSRLVFACKHDPYACRLVSDNDERIMYGVVMDDVHIHIARPAGVMPQNSEQRALDAGMSVHGNGGR